MPCIPGLILSKCCFSGNVQICPVFRDYCIVMGCSEGIKVTISRFKYQSFLFCSTKRFTECIFNESGVQLFGVLIFFYHPFSFSFEFLFSLNTSLLRHLLSFPADIQPWVAAKLPPTSVQSSDIVIADDIGY